MDGWMDGWMHGWCAHAKVVYWLLVQLHVQAHEHWHAVLAC